MAGVIYKGVRATDGRKVQLTATDDPINSAGSSILQGDLGSANGIATLDGSSLVVQDPASTSESAVANTIPKRDSNADVLVPLTPTSASGAASKGYVDSQITLGRSWKELLLVPEQLVTGGSGGIREAFIIAIQVDLAAGDTITLTDGVATPETYTGVAAAPGANQFLAGTGIGATTTSLVASINANSVVWNAVETTGLDSYFSGSLDPQIVIYRQTPSTSNADRCYGTIANAQSDVQVVNFGASQIDYATTGALQADLPAADPTTDYSGTGRLFASLFPGETHRVVENNASYTWDGDDQLWQKTSAGEVLDGAGLGFTGSTLNVGDANRGVQVNADDLEIDASEIAATSGGLKAGGNSWQLTIEPADFAGTGLEDDGSDNLRIAASAAGDGLTGGAGSALAIDVDVPRWRQYTVAESAFTAAATTEDIELFSLPAGGVIQAVKIKHSTAFSGGTLSAFTLSVGITGTLDKYATAFDVFQATGNTVFQLTNVVSSENHGAATSIRLAAISTGDNVVSATAGSVDVWVLWSVAV